MSKDISFTTSDGIKIFAELTISDDLMIIDIIGSSQVCDRDFIAAVEYDRETHAIRVVSFDGNDQDGEPASIINFNTSFLVTGE